MLMNGCKYLSKSYTVHGDSELDEESNHKYPAHAEPVEARQTQGERYCSVHAEPDEARQAQCERGIYINFPDYP